MRCSPSFSADGKTLFFCSARKQAMPDSIEALKYHLCAVAFDAETRTFGTKVDTLFHAEKMEKSVSFPRVSPDGRFLMVTSQVMPRSRYGIRKQISGCWICKMETN